MNKNLSILLIVGLLILAFALHLAGSYYVVHMFSLIGIYVLLVLGLNLVVGFTGLLDLGFMAVYAIGAYSAALLSAHGVSFWPCMLISILVTVCFRYLLGRPILRLRGDYLAIVTLGFGEITRLVLNNFDYLTNGPKGLPKVGQSIQPIKLFTFPLIEEYQVFYLVLLLVILGIVVILLLERSKYSRAFVAIREDEVAAEVCGINTTGLKMMVFLLSAVFAAVAGTVYAHWIGFVSPESFTFWESILLVSMIVLGGIGNLFGVILGTILIVGLPELLRSLLGPDFVVWRMLIFGLAMVLMVLFRPQGLVPEKRHEWEIKDSKVDA